jgi:hypothetical protein
MASTSDTVLADAVRERAEPLTGAADAARATATWPGSTA